MVGDSDAVQTFGARGRNQIFRTGNTVSGKKRMRVQVDIKRHGERLWPLLFEFVVPTRNRAMKSLHRAKGLGRFSKPRARWRGAVVGRPRAGIPCRRSPSHSPLAGP